MSSELARLHKFIVDRYSSDGLKTLCFELSVDYDDLAGDRISVKAGELLLNLGRNHRLDELLDAIRQERSKSFRQAGFSLDPTAIDALYDALRDFATSTRDQQLPIAIAQGWVEQSYREAVAREWTYLRTESGLAPPLTGVYVMLQAIRSDRNEPAAAKADIAPLESRQEHAGISLTGLFSRKEGGQPQDQAPLPPPPPVPLSKALKEEQHLVILGEAGAGKSTTLQYIGLYFANEDKPSHASLDLDEDRIPVLVSLKARIQEIKDGGLSQALAAEIKKFTDLTEAEALTGVRVWRDAGRLAILLDGLDEVPEEHREDVSEAIRVFTRSEGGQKCRVVVASRMAGYQNQGQPFREYTLKPFETAEDAIPYVAGWLAAVSGGEQTGETREAARALVEQMAGQHGLVHVLDNPLLLRLAAELYANDGEIVDKRTTLYRHYVEKVARKRAEDRGADKALWAKATAALEAIAWAILAEGTRQVAELEAVLDETLSLPETAIPVDMLSMLRQQAGFCSFTMVRELTARWPSAT